MTLCAAWIRQVNDSEELVFATDSTLTGGERWDHGIKLFELPRKDCLLSFAGSTARAYPLILNLVSSISFDKYLNSPSTHMDLPDTIDLADEDIYGLHLDFLRDCYPNGSLCDSITEKDKHKIKQILKEVAYSQFLGRQIHESDKEEMS